MSLNQQAKRDTQALPGAIKGKAFAKIKAIIAEKLNADKFKSTIDCVRALSEFCEAFWLQRLSVSAGESARCSAGESGPVG